MSDMLTTTVNKRVFDRVFVEVPCTGDLETRAQKQLRLFRMREIFDNSFNLDSLQNYVAMNIGRYVFSRSKVKEYYNEEDEMNIGLYALEKMQRAGGADERGTGNELGEVLLYAFLETVLDAPKIYSKIELNSTVRDRKSVSDSIHLRLLDPDGAQVSYELVFGSSSIVGDLQDAVVDAFSNVARIKESSGEELHIVDAAVFDLPEDDPVVSQINKFIKPGERTDVTRTPAYGIFLGYTLGLDKDRTDDEYRELVEKKMDDDIHAVLPFIQERINSLQLRNKSFYIYVIPMDDAEKDKKRIMKSVLKEGELIE